MGGGWVGYVYVLLCCGMTLALIAASTFALYALARARERGGGGPEVRARSVGPTVDDG